MAELDTDTIALIGVIFVIVADKASYFLKSRGIDLTGMTRKVNDLHKWHDLNETDSFRSTLEKSLETLARNGENQTKILERMETQLNNETSNG